MSAARASITGASPSTERQLTPTELEIQESRRQAELRARRLGVPPKKTNGAAPATPFPVGETIDTGIGAAVTAKQAQAEGIKREMPPAKCSPEPKSVDGDGKPSRVTDLEKGSGFPHARTTLA